MPLPTPLKIPPGAAPGLPGGSAAMPRTGEPQAGLVFVTYDTLSGAAKAKEALHKRQFDGNTVLATFVPEEPPTGDAPPA